MDRTSSQQLLPDAPSTNSAVPATSTDRRREAYRIFDASLDHYFVLGTGGALVYANHALLQHWHKTASQAVGLKLSDLGYSSEVIDDVEQALRALLSERVSRVVRMDYPSSLGLTHAFETVLTPVFDETGVVIAVAGVARDITERVRRDAALRSRDARSTALLKLGDQLRSLTTPAELAFASAQMLGETLQVSRCGYATINPVAQTVMVERDWTAPGVTELVRGQHFFRDYGSYFEDLRRGELVVISDADLDPRTRDTATLLKSICAQAVVNVPVIEAGRLVAILYLNNATARTWSPEELTLVREVADRTRIAVERRRSEQAVAADLKDTRMLRDLGARLVAEGDPKVLFDEILAAAIQITGADGGTIQLLDEEKQTLSLAAIEGMHPRLVARFEQVDATSHSPCGVALARGERVFLDFDVPASQDPSGDLHAHLDAGFKSAQSTPLVSRSGRRVGMFSTHWREHCRLGERELRYLDLLGRQAADLIERTQVEHAMRQSERQLRDADQRKDEFIAMLAHELRNPLVPIRTGVELLKNAREQPVLIDNIQPMMERQVRHMVRLIDDLLDVSRITSGKIELQRQHVTLASIVGTAVEANRSAINAGNLVLTVDLSDPHLVLNVDPTRFAQVLSNLLQNATKFTGSGGRIGISARVEPAERRGSSELVLEVTDSGVGISPAMLPRVFDLFAQASTGGQVNTGLGIGLALARRLVEMHGGAISAHSEGVDLGSRFTIRLRVSRDLEQTGEARGRLRRDVGHLRVLVIDDNHDAANVMAMLVETFGGTALAAYDGESGLAKLREFRPSVVLLDIGMPGMDGYEVCRRIRDQAGQAIGVVALTGWGHEKDKQLAADAGFDAHLTKPADPARLAEVIGGLSQRRRAAW
jgi:PAS domain S-box-containing protein